MNLRAGQVLPHFMQWNVILGYKDKMFVHQYNSYNGRINVEMVTESSSKYNSPKNNLTLH